MNKFKSEIGSMAVYVTIVLFIMLTFIIAIYMNTISVRKEQVITASKVKESYESDVNNADEIYDNLVGEVIEEKKEVYITDGMIPVKYVNGTGWVRTTEDDPEWYNYDVKDEENGAVAKTWANVVLENASWTTNGEQQILNEDATYVMLVWIPRYAYQIISLYHQMGSEAGNINIAFINTDNEDKNGNKYSEKYPTYYTGSGMSGSSEEGCEPGYVVHPAFNYGGKKLSGFWVGKFETGNTNCTTENISGVYNGIDRTIQIKGNLTSWRSIQVSNIFTVCTQMNNENNIFGLNADDNIVDPHMMKNSEWGAVAYLSKSIYGKEDEVAINNNSNYLTGGGNYANNIAQSTNGNITGIYDMSGGAWEYVAAYIDNSYADDYASNLVNAEDKYKDVYSIGSSDTAANNYAISTPDNEHYGDAVYETSNSSTGSGSWYDDNSFFPERNYPIFFRGGYIVSDIYAGMFCFSNGNGAPGAGGGDAGYGQSFRLTISIPTEE